MKRRHMHWSPREFVCCLLSWRAFRLIFNPWYGLLQGSRVIVIMDVLISSMLLSLATNVRKVLQRLFMLIAAYVLANPDVCAEQNKHSIVPTMPQLTCRLPCGKACHRGAQPAKCYSGCMQGPPLLKVCCSKLFCVAWLWCAYVWHAAGMPSIAYAASLATSICVSSRLHQEVLLYAACRKWCVYVQVDVVGKRNHILAVPMLNLALHWSAKLKGNALASPLTTLLAECRLRLHTHFTQFIMDRVIRSTRSHVTPAPFIMLLKTLMATVQDVLMCAHCCAVLCCARIDTDTMLRHKVEFERLHCLILHLILVL